MKIVCVVPSIDRRKLGEECFAELIVVYPAGSSDDLSFEFRLPLKDPRVAQILAILKQHGHRPWKGFFDGPGINLQYWRKYSVKDWNESKYLTISPRSTTFTRNLPDGRIGFETKKTSATADFARCINGLENLIVPERVKEQLERAHLKGLQFVPAIPMGGSHPGIGSLPLKSNPKRLGQWWALTSDLILPPLSPACDVRIEPDAKAPGGKEPRFPRKPGDPPYVSLHEGLYITLELHYRASDLAGLPEFDAALSNEVFGSTFVGPSRMLIVSNRFYKVCRALEFRVSWTPVRLD